MSSSSGGCGGTAHCVEGLELLTCTTLICTVHPFKHYKGILTQLRHINYVEILNYYKV